MLPANMILLLLVNILVSFVVLSIIQTQKAWPIRGKPDWISCFFLPYFSLSPSLTRTARQIKFIPDRLSVYQPMTKIFVSSEQRVRVGTDLTPRGHRDKRVYGIKVQSDEVHAVLGETRRRIPEYCCTSNSWANEIWLSTPHQEGHSDIKGAAQCSGDTLPKLSCLKAYFMLQKESKANTFVCFCQGNHCSLVF